MRPRLLVAASIAAVLAVPIFTAAPAVAATDHCTDHTSALKVEAGASPATVQVIDTLTGDPVTVTITITGTTFTIQSVDPNLVLAAASWCVKSSTNTNNGTGTTGASTSTNKNGVVQAISYVVIYSVTSEEPPEPCNVTTQSGGQGVTTTVHSLGVDGPTSFLFEWEAFNQPDQFQVFYEGVEIFDTGLVGDNTGEGTGSATVNVPAGTASTVTVTVTGPEAGTLWEYRVNCPAP